MEWFWHPWPWYISGPLIGLIVPLLLLLTGKSLGISSSFLHICSIAMPQSKVDFIRSNDWRKEIWNVIFVIGILCGGFIGNHLLSEVPQAFLPETFHSWSGICLLFLGGILVGFGTRYAGGCTSGHTLMGLSNLNLASLIATISFFIGGLTMTALQMFITGEK